MWRDQVSFLSTFTPRYVGVSCWWISCPLICRILSIDLQFTLLSWEKGRSRWLQSWFCWSLPTTLLPSLRWDSLLPASWWLRWSFGLLLSIMQGRLYAVPVGCGKDSRSQMSSMKITKRVGEMTPPCGTPLIFTEELVCPSSLTPADLWIHVLPSLIWDSLLPASWWLWWSHALLWSINYKVRSSSCSGRGMREDSWSQMSSMKIMKGMGEMTPPWGTPLIFTEELVCPSSLTLTDLWNKQLWIRKYILPQTLFHRSLKSRSSFHTLFKALVRLKKTASVFIFCWKPFSVSLVSSVTWFSVFLFFLKQDLN